METFNAIMKALIFIVMTGAAAIAMFVALQTHIMLWLWPPCVPPT